MKMIVRWLRTAIPIRWRVWLRSVIRRPRPKLGRECYIDATVHFTGASHVRIGDNSVLSQGCWLNVNSINPGEVGIEIGHNCFIGKNNFFSSGASIQVQPYVLTAIDCKFLGSSHIIDNPNAPVLTSGTLATWTIRVGTNCFIGAGATLVGNITVGHGSVIGALSLVTESVPPFCMVVGNPARIVKRFSHVKNRWIAAEDFDALDADSEPDEASYLKALEAGFGSISMPYPAAGRGMGHL